MARLSLAVFLLTVEVVDEEEPEARQSTDEIPMVHNYNTRKNKPLKVTPFKIYFKMYTTEDCHCDSYLIFLRKYIPVMIRNAKKPTIKGIMLL
ncbi:hypothetical protein ACF0H5_003512 [Mactra antiquata]